MLTFYNLATCFCEYQNGFGNRNGIICEGNEDLTADVKCKSDQWCTGPHNESSAVSKYQDLCENGMKR